VKHKIITHSVLTGLALIMSLILISGCGSPKASDQSSGSDGPVRGGTLNIGLHLPLPTLDWQSSVSHPLPMVFGHVYEGLFGFGRDFTAAPDLVDSYEVSEDGKTWTFVIREGVTFHNGDLLDSEDVKASLDRWHRIGPKGSGLASLDGIETPDSQTVVMNFNAPMGQFLLLLLGSDENKAIVMPKEVADASTRPGQVTEVIGTGPYRFDEYKEDQYVRLKRFDAYSARSDNPNYQAGKKEAHVDEILFWIVPEASTRVAGLESGEYEIITEVPDAEAIRLRDIDDVDPVKNGPGVLLYLMFNHQQGLTSDINIRRAFQAMVDPSEITAMVVSDSSFGKTYSSIYSPESAFNSSKEPSPSQSAEAYLNEAGYNGEPLFIQVIATDIVQQRVAVALVEQAKRVGLNLQIQSYDLSTWVARRRDASVMNMYSSAGYWVDPSLWQPEFNGTFPSEEVGFSNAAADELFANLASATSLEERKVLAGELQAHFFKEVALVNLGYIYRLVAKGNSVHDPHGNLALGNLTLHGVWID